MIKTPWNKGRKTGPLSLEHRLKLSMIKKGKMPRNFMEMQRKGILSQKINHGNSGTFKLGHTGIKNIGNTGGIPWNKGNGDYMTGAKHFFFGKHHSNLSKHTISVNRSGISAWNKGLTPRTEKYTTPRIYINGKPKLESHVVWCSQKENLSHVPKGFVIHHLDINPKNNNPNNLCLLDIKSHNKIHTGISNLLRGKDGI